jgi:hypothetical protein
MESPSDNKIKFHFDVLPKETKRALDFLSSQEWLGKSEWYLAGGTALALQSGHRKSVDLDFFTKELSFDNVVLLKNLSSSGDLKIDINKDRNVYAVLLGAKISFISYPFFIPQQQFIQYGSVKILHQVDVAVMKTIAISQRGKKRDFFDLYWSAHNIEPLENTIKRLKIQYPSVAHDYHHILKSMMYFVDAEIDPEPEIYFDADWQKVKDFFTTEIPIITKKLIGIDDIE